MVSGVYSNNSGGRMAEKSQLKEYICLGNISLKGESGAAYVKDQYYTAEEVRRAPKDKKHKFVKLETIDPGKIDGTEQELKQLIQRQQIKNQTLEAALAEYEGSDLQSALSEIRKLEDEIERLNKKPAKPKSKGRKPASSAKKPEQPEVPSGSPILSSTGGQTGDEKL